MFCHIAVALQVVWLSGQLPTFSAIVGVPKHGDFAASSCRNIVMEIPQRLIHRIPRLSISKHLTNRGIEKLLHAAIKLCDDFVLIRTIESVSLKSKGAFDRFSKGRQIKNALQSIAKWLHFVYEVPQESFSTFLLHCYLLFLAVWRHGNFSGNLSQNEARNMRRGKCKRVLGEGLRRKIVRHKLGFFQRNYGRNSVRQRPASNPKHNRRI